MQKISLFNNLSNDLLFEIFDYLDVLHLFQAFFNLNQYFNLLIIDRHICFQANMICLKSDEFLIYKNLILPKIGCYIRYLSISDELNYFKIILRSISLTNLIFIRLYNIKLNELKILVGYCKLKYIFIDTKYIKNEKDLNELFRILFNKQLELYSIQCNFHTKLYFLQEKYKLSQLKKVIIDCECFSSDFIILISQLPKLRYISACINDHNREYMDKDIDNLTGNESLRSVILNIENIELNRLLLILTLIPNVRIIELNGRIDFDINYLLEFEGNYTSFRYMNYKFLSLSILYIIGLIFFLNGFLLTRRVILQNSNGTIPSSKLNEFNQIIFIVIDALRYDFIKPNNNNSIINNYQNQMPFIRELLEIKSKQSVLLKLIADPPTTTLQRLKALTTGTLPTFIDISYNFIGYEIEEDNILNQLKKSSQQRNISLLGDDTWLALYPNIKFKDLYVYPSFDVHDLDTVDNGILKHLWNVIEDNQHEQLSFTIAHFLGVDHCGHRYGPLHIEMKRKLNQMDDVIRNITLLFDKLNSSSSLLIVIGDHGMTQQGDHGGDELNEIETAMFIYTNKPNYFSLNKEITVSQIDLVPTLSWFLNILIPFSSLGMMIIDIIPIEQRYIAMKLNFQQIEIYLKYISLSIPLSDKLQELRASLHTIFISFDRENNLTNIQNLFKEFQLEFQTHFRRQWSTFNISRIIIGLFIMLISCLILMYFQLSKKIINYGNMIFNIIIVLIYFSISFSNSFIINEGICLYFLLQTIILTTKMNILQKILLSFLLFLTRAFLICREEQQPHCLDPLWLVSKSSDTSNYILPLISSIIWLFILFSICNYSYILPYISFLCIIGYWFNISNILLIYYMSIIIQICFVLFNPSHFDTLIYSILIFVVGYRFSFVIFLQYFIYYIAINNNNNRSFSLFLCILTDYFFYATGHQPVISQIRWTAAFPSQNSFSLIINSLFVRGIFVLIETFSSQILNIILIRKMMKKINEKELLKNILIIDYWKLMNTSLSVFILRRHLMLWKIFSPRFLFQLIGFFIKILFVFLTIKLKKIK